MMSATTTTDGTNGTNTPDWSEANQRYLTTSLAWLRLRLDQLIQHDHPVTPQSQPVQQEQHHGLFGGRAEAPPPVTPRSTPTTGQLARYLSEMKTAESQEPPPALVALSKRLGLSQFEREVLLLCVAMELDTRVAALCAHAQDDANRPYPTFALALALFENPSWDVVSPERPLRFWRLLEINQPSTLQLTTSPLRADERIVNYVKGLDYLDDRLAMLVTPLEIDAGHEQLSLSHEHLVKTIIRHWERSEQAFPLIQLVGPDALSKQLVAFYASTALQQHLYRMPVEMLPQQAADLETLARLWHRESLLLPLALYLDAQESDGGGAAEGQTQSLVRFLSRSEGVFFLGVRETWARVGRANIALDVAKPTSAEQQAAWQIALGDQAGDIPVQLAGQFHLNVTTIHRIARERLEQLEHAQQQQQGESDASPVSLIDLLWESCRIVTRPRLDMLAQRLDLKATWDNLVLPPEETDMLHQIADQVAQRGKVYEEWGFAARMNRGLGINALFCGDSGVGKTMAAEVLANALHLSLYRIDLSSVVSKYIGETERNLRRLFDAAEDGGAILFFDEADALFGKRSEVKDSHDRYANIEINYLLQRIEAYEGLSILATNMKSALDTAFLRRLRFIINFPFPGFNERKSMWQKVFPPQTPVDALDYDRLARLNLVGGSIHNIALNAAFMAAQAGTTVTMAHIFAATRVEFRKTDRQFTEADLRSTATTMQGGKP
ncbi:MAG: ATP-binding protein [Ktedonobacteraceae bacterium]